MKRCTSVALALCLMAPAAAFAGKTTYGIAGCGLGSMAFGDEKGPIQILAATVNGLFGTQTFGITTGTSNCVDGGGAKVSLDQTNFTKINFASLSQEAATGSGEYLDAYTELFGCSDTAKPAFAAVLKQNHRDIFEPSASAEDVVLKVRHHVRANADLAPNCDRI